MQSEACLLYTSYHEGREVLVLRYDNGADRRSWCQAVIIGQCGWHEIAEYAVRFLDGARAVFDAEHIQPLGGHEYVGWRDEKGRPCNGPW